MVENGEIGLCKKEVGKEVKIAPNVRGHVSDVVIYTFDVLHILSFARDAKNLY